MQEHGGQLRCPPCVHAASVIHILGLIESALKHVATWSTRTGAGPYWTYRLPAFPP